MDFSFFKPFNETFNEKYGSIQKQYPYAFLLIEKQIRNFESGSVELSIQNLKKSSRLNFGRTIRSTIFAHTYEGSSQSQFYMSFERFDWLESRLTQRITEKGFLRFKQVKQLGRLATRGLAYPKFMRIAAKSGIVSALERKELLKKMDVEGKRNFELIKAVIVKSKIRLFFTDGDTQPHAQMYCRAARELNIPYVIFAHGYIQNPMLVGIAPINGLYLIPWTRNQFEDLAAHLDDHDARKLRYFGYPKELFSGVGCTEEVLIAWHTVLDRDREADLASLLATIYRVRAEGYKVKVRLHPKDSNDDQLCQFLAKQNVDISRRSLQDDIRSAGLVIGSFSSVMVEASMSGKKVLQLEAYSSIPFEQVPVLHSNETIREAAQNLERQFSLDSFDFEAFEAFCQEILT